MILPLILHSQNGVTESAVWRLYAGKISNLNPPCKLSPLLGILADRRRHLLHLNVTVSTQHTPSVGPAPRPSLGTACQPKRNFGSFCNNFWNLHAFLNSRTHLSQSLLWRGLWIKLPGKEDEILLLPSAFGLGRLFIADSVLQQVCLPGFDYYTHLNLLQDLLLKLREAVHCSF